jgi:hypothetical protein
LRKSPDAKANAAPESRYGAQTFLPKGRERYLFFMDS